MVDSERHTGRDCWYPEHMDVNSSSHPWPLDSGNPYRNDGRETDRTRTEQSFCVPKAEIAANGYDLAINRYKEVVHEEVEHLPPKEILAKLAELEVEIQAGMKELGEMLN